MVWRSLLASAGFCFSKKSNLFLFPALSPLVQFYPVYHNKKISFKMELPHRIFLPIEKPSFSKKDIVRRVPFEWNDQDFHEMNPPFLADAWGAELLVLLGHPAHRIVVTPLQAPPSQKDGFSWKDLSASNICC